MKKLSAGLFLAVVSLLFVAIGVLAAPMLPGAISSLSGGEWRTVTERPCENAEPPCPNFCESNPCCPCGEV